jgi:hypothetical protein
MGRPLSFEVTIAFSILTMPWSHSMVTPVLFPCVDDAAQWSDGMTFDIISHFG